MRNEKKKYEGKLKEEVKLIKSNNIKSLYNS